MVFALPLFLLIVAAVFGGILARILKLPMLVGYILAGLIFGAILPSGVKDVARLSEIGTILLLFSIGVELSFSRLSATAMFKSADCLHSTLYTSEMCCKVKRAKWDDWRC